MKRVFLGLAIGLLAICNLFGGNTQTMGDVSEQTANDGTVLYLGFTKQIKDGGYFYITNTYRYPWRIASIGWSQPNPLTNAFSITQISTYYTNLYQGSVVTTNSFGTVETNMWWGVTNTIAYGLTNAAYARSFTNVNNVLIDSGDLPEDWYILGGDIIQLTWTPTSDLNPISNMWFRLNGKR